MSDFKDSTNRHLRHKLQSLGRRLDELEEAASKLQKAEDELLDLQDKVIQAEGSNSSLLADVETLRKRVLKIEGKDEEIRKAEDLCRSMRERLEEEEKLTLTLRTEIERLQARMAELEKLEEAFGKCKSDCSQLGLNLNEERNLNRKLSTEVEGLKARLKEVDASETRLEKAEQALTAELERLKGLSQAFMLERKRLVEKQREDEKLISKLTEKLEQQKNRMSSADPLRRDSRDLRIEDELSTVGITSKLSRKKSLDYLKFTEDAGLRNKVENEKNSLEGQEDNKVHDLNQEVERLKSRLKQLEDVEEGMKSTEIKNSELKEKLLQEKSRNQTLAEQVEQLKTQIPSASGNNSSSNGGAGNGTSTVLENGKADSEDVGVRGGFRQEKPKFRSAACAEPLSSKYKKREVSPLQRKEARGLRSRDLSHSADSSPKTVRRAQSPAHKPRRGLKAGASDNGLKDTGSRFEERSGVGLQASMVESKKTSVLSRYPPAANDQKPWKNPLKASESETKKSRVEKFSKVYVGSDSESNSSDGPFTKAVAVLSTERDTDSDPVFENSPQESSSTLSSLSKANGSFMAYRSHVSPAVASDQGSEGHSSASESESTGSRPLAASDRESLLSASSRSASGGAKYPRYSRKSESHSAGSSTRSSYEEDGHRALMSDSANQEQQSSLAGLEIRRVCSPREALRSKAIIKPVIVETDRKEMMGGGGDSLVSKPRISSKPSLTGSSSSSSSTVTSSITIYPNDPASSRTSSRSSSVCSEPITRQERHTSTSNIIIGGSGGGTNASEQRGKVCEISIPKSDIKTLRPNADGGDSAPIAEASHLEISHRRGGRASATLRSPENTPCDINNDTESGFESSSSSSTTTMSSWRSHGHHHHQHHLHQQQQSLQDHSKDDSLSEMRNVTVRSTWRNRGATQSVDEVSRAPEDGPESTWRAYRATTVLDMDESVPPMHTHTQSHTYTQTTLQTEAGRGGKPSPAEVYMQRITSKDPPGPSHRGNKTALTQSTSTDSGLGRSLPHEPVSAKERQPWSRRQPSTLDADDQQPATWRRATPSPSTFDLYERSSRTDAGRAGQTNRSVVGRTPDRNKAWSSRHLDN